MRHAIMLLALTGIAAARPARAQSIEWAAPIDGTWLDTSSWSPSNVPDTQTEDAILGAKGAYAADLLGAGYLQIRTLRLLNPDASLRIHGDSGAERYLTLLGPVVENHGTIIINPDGIPGAFGIAAAARVTFDGPGEIVLNAAPGDLGSALFSRVGGGGFSACIIGPDQRIRGTGLLNGVIVNQGAVVADVPGRILEIGSGNFSNSGLVIATGGGLLRFQPNLVEQAATGRIVADASVVDLRGTTIVSGRLESVNGGVFEVASQSTLTGVVNAAYVHVLSGVSLRASASNHGEIVVGPSQPGAVTRVRNAGDTSFSGAGFITLRAAPGEIGSAQLLLTDTISRFTNFSSHHIRGAGRFYAPRIRNLGFVAADTPGEVLLVESPSIENIGTMTSTAGGVLRLAGAQWRPSAGRLVADGGDIELTGNVTMQSMESLNDGAFRVRAGQQVTIQDGALAGTLHVESTASLIVSGALSNTGAILINPGAVADIRGAVSGDGSIVLGADPEDPAAATIAPSAGATFTNAGGHVIIGTGQISGDFVNSAVIAPGIGAHAAGHIVRVGGYHAQAGAVHLIDIGLAPPGAANDRLTITNSARLGGALVVRLPDGVVPPPGSSYTILDAITLSGEFESVDLPILPSGAGTLRLHATSTSLEIVVEACPADWDGAGVVDSRDFFAFLLDFFAGDADFNDDGVTTGSDFFAFVSAFLSGC